MQGIQQEGYFFGITSRYTLRIISVAFPKGVALLISVKVLPRLKEVCVDGAL